LILTVKSDDVLIVIDVIKDVKSLDGLNKNVRRSNRDRIALEWHNTPIEKRTLDEGVRNKEID
jgi:hypothetical protein